LKDYKVPFINYPRAHDAHKEEYEEAVLKCMRKGYLIYRNDLIKFEDEFSSYCGCQYGIGTGSCTGAMFIALKALGIGLGDEVITVSHTYIATIDVIKAVGATPVLVDVEPHSMVMNPWHLKEAISPHTKAILPVHLNGRMVHMPEIMEIADRYNLYVIEDAAQAVGAEIDGKKAGSWGDIGCFSFYPAKILGWYGEGGMAVTNNSYLKDMMFPLRDHGEFPNYRYPPEFRNDPELIGIWGYNTILDNMAAAVLRVKLKYLPETLERRRQIARQYLSAFCRPEWDLHQSWQNYVLKVPDGKRDALQHYLYDQGIETMVHWRTPNHKQKALGLHFHLPVTESLSQEVLSLPLYPELADFEVEYVIKAVKAFFES